MDEKGAKRPFEPESRRVCPIKLPFRRFSIVLPFSSRKGIRWGKLRIPSPTVPDLFPIYSKLERKDQTDETEGRTRKPRRRNRGRDARCAVDDGERDAKRVAMDEEPDPAAAARDRGGWWRAGASKSEARKAGRAHGRRNRKGRRS